MSVIEKFSTISNSITTLINFVTNDETIKEDFNDYLNAISAKNLSQAEVQALRNQCENLASDVRILTNFVNQILDDFQAFGML